MKIGGVNNYGRECNLEELVPPQVLRRSNRRGSTKCVVIVARQFRKCNHWGIIKRVDSSVIVSQ